MDLNLAQIKAVTAGAVRVCEEGGYFRFYRFTEEQERAYAKTGFVPKTYATAGIRLAFRTNSRTLSFAGRAYGGSSRKFYLHEVFVDGEKIGEVGNIDSEGNALDEGGNPTGTKEFAYGAFSGCFDLGVGEKVVEVYFPWSAISKLSSVSLDDGATLEPVKRERTMLLFGDSITHGYDAHYPSMSYASRLADALGADGYNKAIGGEVFCPRIAAARDDVDPDYITVAYGTNDWSGRTRAFFESHCADFFRALSENYPDARIFAITPIWRKNHDRVTRVGRFEEAGEFIAKTAAQYPSVTVIDGWSLVPHELCCFSPDGLHPNDLGFDHYFTNLYAEIRKHL